MSLLEVDGLNSYYADSHVLFDIALRIETNEVIALLGRNGAGKSTTLKSIAGAIKPRRGSITFDGKQIAGLEPFRIANEGVQLVPRSGASSGRSRSRRTSFSLPSRTLTRCRWMRSTPTSRACENAANWVGDSCQAASNKCWRLPGR